MREALSQDLLRAMADRDGPAVSALRSALAAIANAEAVDPEATERPSSTSTGSVSAGSATGSDRSSAPAPFAASVGGLGAAEVPRRVLTDADVRHVVAVERTERLAAAAYYDQLGQIDRAARLRAEASVLSRHLPD